MIANALCLGLVGFGKYAGNQASERNASARFYISLVLITFFALICVAVQEAERGDNLFQLLRVKPHDGTLRISLAIKKFEKENRNSQHQVTIFKQVLLDPKNRTKYISHGLAGLSPIRNETDTAEATVKILGATLLWYGSAVLVICGTTNTAATSHAFGKGLFILAVVLILEFALRGPAEEASPIQLSAWPYHTKYDYSECLHVLAAYTYSLLLCFFSYFSFETKESTLATLKHMISRNEFFLLLVSSDNDNEIDKVSNNNTDNTSETSPSKTKRRDQDKKHD